MTNEKNPHTNFYEQYNEPEADAEQILGCSYSSSSLTTFERANTAISRNSLDCVVEKNRYSLVEDFILPTHTPRQDIEYRDFHSSNQIPREAAGLFVVLRSFIPVLNFVQARPCCNMVMICTERLNFFVKRYVSQTRRSCATEQPNFSLAGRQGSPLPESFPWLSRPPSFLAGCTEYPCSDADCSEYLRCGTSAPWSPSAHQQPSPDGNDNSTTNDPAWWHPSPQPATPRPRRPRVSVRAGK